MRRSRIAHRVKTTPLKTQRRIKLILVKWEDATHLVDDTGPERPGTMLAWTVGFQLARSDKEVTLCMEMFEDRQKRDISTIPMGMVKSIKTLVTLPMVVDD